MLLKENQLVNFREFKLEFNDGTIFQASKRILADKFRLFRHTFEKEDIEEYSGFEGNKYHLQLLSLAHGDISEIKPQNDVEVMNLILAAQYLGAVDNFITVLANNLEFTDIDMLKADWRLLGQAGNQKHLREKLGEIQKSYDLVLDTTGFSNFLFENYLSNNPLYLEKITELINIYIDYSSFKIDEQYALYNFTGLYYGGMYTHQLTPEDEKIFEEKGWKIKLGPIHYNKNKQVYIKINQYFTLVSKIGEEFIFNRIKRSVTDIRTNTLILNDKYYPNEIMTKEISYIPILEEVNYKELPLEYVEMFFGNKLNQFMRIFEMPLLKHFLWIRDLISGSIFNIDYNYAFVQDSFDTNLLSKNWGNVTGLLNIKLLFRVLSTVIDVSKFHELLDDRINL